MPIGGGSFTVQNKVLPGAYINFVSMGTNAKMGERGVAALPLELNWGPEGQVFKLDAADFNATSMKVFGYDPTDANILLVREAMKRAKTLLIYRVNGGGTKASATVGGMTVTAKYGGTRGNAIKVAVITNVDDATKADVVTYLDDMVMDSQTVAKSGGAASLVANDFVTFGTVATLAAATATPPDRRRERHGQRREAHRRPDRFRSGNLQRDRLPWHRGGHQVPVCRLRQASS